MVPDAAPGCAQVPAVAVREVPGPAPAGWNAFAANWNDLGPDRCMADGGRDRRRRHRAFSAGAAGVRRKPHIQSRDHNTLNGGIERWFAPVEPAIGDAGERRSVLFEALTPAAEMAATWHVEPHQFRVGEAGRPTPEGAPPDPFTLAPPLEAALVDDRRVFHGVIPFVPVDPDRPAFRDVLVATFRHE